MADTGWKLAGTGVNVADAGDVGWTDTNGISNGNDSQFALAYNVPKNNGTTQYLHGLSFDFSLPPNSLVMGIEARIRKNAAGSGDVDHTVQIVSGGSRIGANYADTSTGWPTNNTGPANVNYGGPLDMWGVVLSPDDINSSDFGLALRATNTGTVAPNSTRCHNMWLRIHYEEKSSNTGAFFTLFSVKENLKEILKPKPRFWFPEPAF